MQCSEFCFYNYLMINRIYILFLLVPVFHILGMLISRSWTIFPQNVYILQMHTGKMKHFQSKNARTYLLFTISLKFKELITLKLFLRNNAMY